MEISTGSVSISSWDVSMLIDWCVFIFNKWMSYYFPASTSLSILLQHIHVSGTEPHNIFMVSLNIQQSLYQTHLHGSDEMVSSKNASHWKMQLCPIITSYCIHCCSDLVEHRVGVVWGGVQWANTFDTVYLKNYAPSLSLLWFGASPF